MLGAYNTNLNTMYLNQNFGQPSVQQFQQPSNNMNTSLFSILPLIMGLGGQQGFVQQPQASSSMNIIKMLMSMLGGNNSLDSIRDAAYKDIKLSKTTVFSDDAAGKKYMFVADKDHDGKFDGSKEILSNKEVMAMDINHDGKVDATEYEKANAQLLEVDTKTGASKIRPKSVDTGINVATYDSKNNVLKFSGGQELTAKSISKSQFEKTYGEKSKDLDFKYDSAAGKMVTQAYRDLLGRDPEDVTGIDAYTNRLKNGESIESIRAEIANSAEAKSLSGQAVKNVITNAFRDILGKDPKASQLNTYVQKFAGGTSLDDIRKEIADSKQAAHLNQNDITNVINSAFRDFVGRDANSAELNIYALRIQFGDSITDIRNDIEHLKAAKKAIK